MVEVVKTDSVRATKNRFWSFLKKANILGIIGAVIVIAFIGCAVLAPWLSPYDPNKANLLARSTPPAWLSGGSSEHLLGTDQLGRDLLSRLIFGTRVALIVGFGGILLTSVIGVTLGLIAGYFGGWIDSVISRIVDTLLSIPNVLLYLAALGVFGPSLTVLILVIGFINWTTFARVTRGEVLRVKNQEYVEAAVAFGQSTPMIIGKHVLPNILGPLIVVATLNVATIIILEASLSFLGFGVQPPAVTWGRMLADGRDYLATAWWLATFPGLFITALGLGLIFLGDWLRDILDPRL